MSEEAARYESKAVEMFSTCVCCGKPMDGHVPSLESLEELQNQVDTLAYDLVMARNELAKARDELVRAGEVRDELVGAGNELTRVLRVIVRILEGRQ